MATFDNVNIGTSTDLSLCKGLPLLPTGAARAGISVNGKTETLFSKSVQILAWKYNAYASYGIFFGVCGPSVAFLWNVDVNTSSGSGGGQVTLKVNKDSIAAGFVVGANFSARADISSQEWVPYHWYSPWKGRWEDSWTRELAFSVDFINLIISLILYILENKEPPAKNTLLQKVDDQFASALTSTYGMFDSEVNELLAGQGTVTANPTFTVPINLINLTEDLPPPGDALFLFNEVLGKLGGWIAFGPTLSLEVPVTLKLDSIVVDGNEYDVTKYDTSTSTISASGGAPIADTPRVIGANVTHTAGFTLGLGLFFSIGLLKVFSYSYNSPSLDIFDMLGLPNPVPTTSLGGSVCTDLGSGVIFECPTVSLSLPGTLTAGSAATGTVRIDHSVDVDLVIGLTSDHAAVNVPSSVTIPAFETSAQFAFTPGNDCPSAGVSPTPGSSYTAKITATGFMGTHPTATVTVNNVPLTVTFPETTIRIATDPNAVGTIHLPWPAPAGGAVVQLAVLDYQRNPTTPGENAVVPASITVPAGQTSVPVTITFKIGAPLSYGYAFGYYLSADGGCAFGKNESAEFDVYEE